MSDEIFVVPSARWFADKMAELLRKDVDPTIDAGELRRRGFGFWLEQNGEQTTYTIFKNGVEVSMSDLIIDIAGEKLKRDFVRDCNSFHERESNTT